jgi:hypothetical protein
MQLGSFLKRCGPALLIMALIFIASSQPQAGVPNFNAYDWLVKKTGHLAMYAALAWAYWRGLTGGAGRVTWRAAALGVILAALYGATDEFHQSFVEGRGATVLDVGIDTLGAVLGMAFTTAWQRREGLSKRDLQGL